MLLVVGGSVSDIVFLHCLFGSCQDDAASPPDIGNTEPHPSVDIDGYLWWLKPLFRALDMFTVAVTNRFALTGPPPSQLTDY